MKTKLLDKLFDMVNIVLMVFILIITVYPLYYMFIYSVSSPLEAAKGLILFPKEFTWVNYARIFNSGDILNGFAVSVSRAVIGTIVTVFGSSIVAYIMTKSELPFRKVIYRLIVMTMYLSSGIIPWYMTMVSYGLKNSFFLYVLPSMVSAFYVILIKTYIEETISPSLEESAEMDGAGLMTIFVNIILPLSKPVIAAIALFSAVGQWNSWVDNLFLVSNSKLKTLQLMLYEYLTSTVPSASNMRDISALMSNYRPTASSIRMTISMVTIVPIFLIYPLLQKYFAKGLMIGAIKG